MLLNKLFQKQLLHVVAYIVRRRMTRRVQWYIYCLKKLICKKITAKNIFSKTRFIKFSAFFSIVNQMIRQIFFSNSKTRRRYKFNCTKMFSKKSTFWWLRTVQTLHLLHFSAKIACFSHVFLTKTLPTCFRSVKFDTGTTYA